MRQERGRSSRWLAALLAGCAVALSVAAGDTPEASLRIIEPAAGKPLFDRVAVRLEVTASEPVERIELRLDGAPAAVITAPPWARTIDTGSDNRDKLIEAIAYGAGGELARASLLARGIAIDESVELPLQQLYVTVANRRGRPVTGLERGRFSLRDGGERQRIVTFAGGEVPFTATLLVDASGSMAGDELAIVLRGAERFIDGMGELDQARVVVFSDRLLQVTPFLGPGAQSDAGWKGLEPRGGTAILDHLYLALADLETRSGRRVAILLSDGIDLHSATRPLGLVEVAQRSQAIVYWVRPGQVVGRDIARPVPLASLTNADRVEETLEALERIVRSSGGRVVPVPLISGAGGALDEVLSELRAQYALGYYPDGLRGDGSWREVGVDVRGRYRTRTQSGYYDRPPIP